MARTLVNQWNNSPTPSNPQANWTARIRWYQDPINPNDIRLFLEDRNFCINLHCNREIASHVWFMFKQGAGDHNSNKPFVTDLVKLLETKYNMDHKPDGTTVTPK